MKRLATALSALAASALLVAGVGAAQEATPVAPDPALCTLAPPTFEQVAMYAASPAAEQSEIVSPEPADVPAADGTPTIQLPDGEPVDDATRAAVEQSMIVNVACLNTGSTLLAMAVYTDTALADIIGGAGELSREFYDSLATPEAISQDEWTIIVEFQEMVMLPDGRVAAIIVGDNQTDDSEPASATLFYLAEKDGHWYIDDYVNPD